MRPEPHRLFSVVNEGCQRNGSNVAEYTEAYLVLGKSIAFNRIKVPASYFHRLFDRQNLQTCFWEGGNRCGATAGGFFIFTDHHYRRILTEMEGITSEILVSSKDSGSGYYARISEIVPRTILMDALVWVVR
jgi:hypothetical protein